MNKKTILQVLMVFLIAIISLWFYLEYFNKDPKIIKKDTTLEKIDTDQSSSSTYIDNINYVSFDTKGNKYQIQAEKAEIDINNSDIIFLENVTAYIFIKDSETIKITSEFGKYNSKNYDTIFSKNVIIVYSSHKITGEYLDFSFLDNLGTISTNVIYAEGKKSLFADKIEMNLATKDTKIFMTDKTKKVIIKSTK
jgi:LPS export ABC transporter protein LptC|tara:strand:- start:207 stop:791 length:585 start_codon:yes stop_codon:yes gene_type:complete